MAFLTSPPQPSPRNSIEQLNDAYSHIVETGRVLLHHGKLPPNYWSYAFTIVTYLIIASQLNPKHEISK